MLQLLRKKKNSMSDKVTPDIDGLTDEPAVHQCDVQAVKYIFADDSKKMVQMINKYK